MMLDYANTVQCSLLTIHLKMALIFSEFFTQHARKTAQNECLSGDGKLFSKIVYFIPDTSGEMLKRTQDL